MQEDRLNKGQHIALFEALKHLHVGYLAVHDAVTKGIFSVLDDLFIGSENHVDGAVTDCVYDGGAAMLSGYPYHLIEALLSQCRDSLCGGIVIVGLPHKGGTGTKASVHEHLKGSYLKETVADSGPEALGKELIELVGLHEVDLLIDSQCGSLLLNELIGLPSLTPLTGAHVHGLNGGDTALSGMGHGYLKSFCYGLRGSLRHDGKDL